MPYRSLHFDIQQAFESLNRTTIVSIADKNGVILHANEMFCQISGYEKEELIGKKHNIVNSGHHPAAFWEEFWRTISSGNNWEGEVKNKKKNGEYYWVYTIVCPQFNQNKEVESYISFRFDITDRKSLESQLGEEQKAAIHLEKLAELGEISSGLTHEINNPLTIISWNFALIKKKFKDQLVGNPEFDKHSSAIEDNIERITKIIKTFRKYVHKSSEEVANDNKWTANEIVDNTLNLVSEKLKGKGIVLTKQIEELSIPCDLGQIEQVLVNFIVNSIYEVTKYPEKWIHIEVRKVDDQVEFSVTDSGPGLPPDIQEKVTKAFFTTKPVGEGTGLGLSISKKIIAKHGGSLYYDPSSPNTRFAFKLPLQK